MIFTENDQTLIPLYHKVIPKLNGNFRAARKFRPFQILLEIITIQLAFWLTALGFQIFSLTIPFFIIKNGSILWPNFNFLFKLENYATTSILNCLNCLNIILSSFLR